MAMIHQRERSEPAWKQAGRVIRYIVLNALFPCCLTGAAVGSIWMLTHAVQVGAGLKPSAVHRAECARMVQGAECARMVQGQPLREAAVHRYQGRVAARTRGSFGTDGPLYQALDSDLVLTVDDGDPLFVDRSPRAESAPRRTGDVYVFCGVPRERVALWPIVGHSGGVWGGPVYEAPDETRYRRILWVADIPDQPN